MYKINFVKNVFYEKIISYVIGDINFVKIYSAHYIFICFRDLKSFKVCDFYEKIHFFFEA